MSTVTDEEDSEARKLVANERAKLVATYFNGVAVGVLIVGGIAPIFTFMFSAGTSRPSSILIILGGVICLGASAYISLPGELSGP